MGKEDREYITVDIANEYHQKAQHLSEYGHDIGGVRSLKEEMCRKYGLTELEAFNILHGYHIGDYVGKYERLKNGIVLSNDKKAKDEESEVNASINDSDWLFDRIAELENEFKEEK